MNRTRLGLIARLVYREIPHSLRHFGVLIACIALGVASIVAVVSLSRALEEGLSREGRVILGGDAAFTLVQREASAQEFSALARHGTLSQVTLLRGMTRAANGESTLGEVKAVDPAHYPKAGALKLKGRSGPEERALTTLLAPDSAGRPGLIADPVLTGRLGIGIGDPVQLGEGQFHVAAHLASEPDKLSSGIGFGPRVIVAREALPRTGLLQPGALTRFQYRLLLPPGTSEAQLDSVLKAVEKDAPEAGWQVASRLKASPQLQRQMARFLEFLTLVGLTALLIGGVGVANAARAFAEVQVLRIATLKSLGASRGFVFTSALAQVLGFALIGIALGILMGVALPTFALKTFGNLLPFPLAPGVYGSEMALGLAYGLATTILFSILPLARAKAVEASLLFRDNFGQTRFRPSLGDWLFLLVALGAFIALALGFAQDRRIAGFYLVGAAASIALLRLAAFLVMRLARALPHPRNPALRLALANLHRPGSLAPTVLLSFGLGLTLLVMLTFIDLNLTRQFRAALPGVAPTFFFVDIPAADMPRFEAYLHDLSPEGGIERVPQLRGRIVELQGRPVGEVKAAEKTAWALEGDRGITYAATPPEGSTIVAGEWWPRDYTGQPLVSFARDVADGLGLKVGDTIAVNVLGRRIETRIANLREVRWQRLGINFVMVFSPNTFAGAPYTYLATLALPAAAPLDQEVAIAKRVATDFPAISTVRVKEMVAAIDGIVEQLTLAIRTASSLAVLSSILVLAGALSTSARSRQHDAVVLKTLGATRRTLVGAFSYEYALLGCIAGLFALVCGSVAARFVVVTLMKLDFVVPLAAVSGMTLGAIIATVALGMMGTWRILGHKPANYLRHA